MPYKAKKPCARTGCRHLTNEWYCEEHAKAEAKRYDQFERDPASKKRYGKSWAKIRAAFLSQNPLCELCHKDGRLTPAQMVHHKVKLTDGGTNEWPNLMALCHECHSRLHAKQGDYF